MVIYICQDINFCPAAHTFRNIFFMVNIPQTPCQTVNCSIPICYTYHIKTIPLRCFIFSAIADINDRRLFLLQACLYRPAKHFFIFRINKNGSVMIFLYIIRNIKKKYKLTIFYCIDQCPVFYCIILYQFLMVLLRNHSEKFILLFLFILLPHSNLFPYCITWSVTFVSSLNVPISGTVSLMVPNPYAAWMNLTPASILAS